MDHSDSERGNRLPPYGLLFPISSKGSFIHIIPQSWSTGGFEKKPSGLLKVVSYRLVTKMFCIREKI